MAQSWPPGHYSFDMEPEITAEATAHVLPCSNCGAPLKFAPKVGRLTCPTCGTVNDAPIVSSREREAARAELDYASQLQAQSGSSDEITALIVTCPQCGAQTQLPAHIVASACAFCATPLMSVTTRSEQRIKPRGIVPFVLEPAQAQELFRAWIRGRWFAPNALKRTVKSVDGVRGVYLPCWTFDAQTVSDYSGERGIDREVRETRMSSNGQSETVTHTETDWYPASGTVHVAFDDTLIPASESVPPQLAEVLQGWDIAHLEPYTDAYVAGFTVEAYQVALEPAFEKARIAFGAGIQSAIERDIGGNRQRVHSVSTQYNAVTFKHLLLPAWICSYQFGGTSWRVVVNGQTGNIKGDRPWSKWKIGFAIAAVSIVLLWVWVLAQQ